MERTDTPERVLRNGADHVAIFDREREQLLATIADLRARLDEERADRRLAQMQLGEALSQVRALTAQRPARRRWWLWR